MPAQDAHGPQPPAVRLLLAAHELDRLVDAFLRTCCDAVYGSVVMREGPVALPCAVWCAAEELHSYTLVLGMVQMLIDAGEIDRCRWTRSRRSCTPSSAPRRC